MVASDRRQFFTANINILMVLRVIGIFLLFESGFMVIPLGIAIYTGVDVVPFAATAILTCIAGMMFGFALPVKSQEMRKREGFLLTSLVWVFFSLFGMLPFIIGTPHLSVSDAFFESMSSFTTTGASILSDYDSISKAIYFWRSLMQWIGGMGIILFTLAVLPMLNSSGGMQMFNAEVTGITHDKLRPRVSETAKQLWLCYVILTVILCILLWVGPMDTFEAICHGLSTMSTGGFSTREESIVGWDTWYVKSVITFFMFIGGINFSILYLAATGNVRRAWNNEAFRIYVRIIIVFYIIFALYLWITGEETTVEGLTINPLFQIVSTLSSTGYLVNGFDRWGVFLLMLIFIMMFFGACAGSTSGGAKLDRGIYLVKHIRNELYRVLHPNSIKAVNYNGNPVAPETVGKVMAFILLYGLIVVVGGVLLTLFDAPLIDSLFASFACVSNTGLGATITGFGGSYDLFPPLGKWILSALMLIGRLEIFTVVILFTPGFWRR